ncbi:uncharacterized protein LOC111697709 [Eurytemora carolleeae]|uniref:uncharacterized protein LOC111697709 n=1 Tax=Eurytemora carolleeae TaxID=1294199 RepID=UPI000C75ECEF|nr:uncharacterized protein LOC111697709 [Eurytemora carolleeae]|eukprot:XP_023323569.1 uncharacterized protein LOC111697709 [Eurytemora affinis]
MLVRCISFFFIVAAFIGQIATEILLEDYETAVFEDDLSQYRQFYTNGTVATPALISAGGTAILYLVFLIPLGFLVYAGIQNAGGRINAPIIERVSQLFTGNSLQNKLDGYKSLDTNGWLEKIPELLERAHQVYSELVN